jgi:hypothetical protein
LRGQFYLFEDMTTNKNIIKQWVISNILRLTFVDIILIW